LAGREYVAELKATNASGLLGLTFASPLSNGVLPDGA
jgi:hypothetical protein